MDSETGSTPKRSASPLEPVEAKRTRLDAQSESKSQSPVPDIPDEDALDLDPAVESFALTQHHQVRCAIQRSIALVLKHDGFHSASSEAMESFTALVETYLESIIEETTRFATASRRDHPNPSDFESMLKLHNLPVASLKPHLRQPIPQTQLAPTWDLSMQQDDDAYTTLPLLSGELSGEAEKTAMSHIPSFFPDFPSRHTYRFTPQEDHSTRDAQKIREEAARTAQQGEDALRKLVRASKMRKQKEVKTLVERDVQGKERFRLWEATMRRFMGADQRADPADQVEIADHSMIVNSDAMFARKEVSRFGKRAAAGGTKVGS